MSETMTSRERVFAALTMQELPDQVPVTPLLLTRGIREGGVTADVAQRNPQMMADCKLKAHEKFGGDVVAAGTDLFTPGREPRRRARVHGARAAVADHAIRRRPGRLSTASRTSTSARVSTPRADVCSNVAEEIRILVAAGVKNDRVLAVPVGGPMNHGVDDDRHERVPHLPQRGTRLRP